MVDRRRLYHEDDARDGVHYPAVGRPRVQRKKWLDITWDYTEQAPLGLLSGFEVVILNGTDPDDPATYVRAPEIVAADVRRYTVAVSVTTNLTNARSAVRALYGAAKSAWTVQGVGQLLAAEQLAMGTEQDVIDAQNVAAAAQSDAANAQADANSNKAELDDIAADGKFTAAEKRWAALEHGRLLTDQPGIEATATALGITTEKTDFSSAMSALTSYLQGLSPAWDDTSTTTPISRTVFKANWDAVYDARQVLLNVTADKASQRADWLQVTGAGKPADNADVTADQIDTLRPDSQYKNSAIGQADVQVHIEAVRPDTDYRNSNTTKSHVGLSNVNNYYVDNAVIDSRANGRISTLRPDSLYHNGNLTAENVRQGAGWQALPQSGATYNALSYDNAAKTLRDAGQDLVSIETLVESQRRGQRTIGGGFIEAFTDAGSIDDWVNHSGVGTRSHNVDASYVGGSGAMKVDGGEKWTYYGEKIPYDHTKLYRIEVRIYRPAGNPGALYAGLIGFDANGIFCNTSNNSVVAGQHYVLASGNTATGWHTYVTYVRGVSSGSAAYSTAGAAVGGQINDPISAPGKLARDVRFISPMLVCNHTASSGYTTVDYFRIDVIDGEGVEENIRRATMRSFSDNLVQGDFSSKELLWSQGAIEGPSGSAVEGVEGKYYMRSYDRDSYAHEWFPVEAGEVYLASGWVFASTANGDTRLGLHVSDRYESGPGSRANGTVGSWLQGGYINWPKSGSGWVYKEALIVIPAGWTMAKGFLQINATSGSTGYTAIIDPVIRKVMRNQRGLPTTTADLASVNSGSVLSAADVGSTATITIAAHTCQYGGYTVSYSAASVTGLSFSTRYFVYCDDPGQVGGTVTYYATTSLSTAKASASRRMLGSITTPANGGGGTVQPPPEDCVDYDTLLPDGRYLRDLQPGDLAECIDVRTGERGYYPLLSMGEGCEPCYALQTPEGAEVWQSESAPMDLPDGSVARTPQMLGKPVYILQSGVASLSVVSGLQPLGRRRVLKPNFGNRMFFAGVSAGQCIATHNWTYKP